MTRDTTRPSPWILAPLALGLLLVGDRAAAPALHRHAHRPGARDTGPREALHFFPGLRALAVRFWTLRIEADVRAGDLPGALRHARQALRVAPDLILARLRLADVLASDLPAREADPRLRMAWIAEAIAVLDEGLERDPFSALLHAERGVLVWRSGVRWPEFDAAFRREHGKSTLEAGVDALVRGAEHARGEIWPLRAASVGLEVRGDARLEAGRAGLRGAFATAADDFARAAALLRELQQFSALAPAALALDLESVEVAGEIAALLKAQATGAAVTEAEIERLHAKRAWIQSRRESP